jgi:hypothetical protein
MKLDYVEPEEEEVNEVKEDIVKPKKAAKKEKKNVADLSKNTKRIDR